MNRLSNRRDGSVAEPQDGDRLALFRKSRGGWAAWRDRWVYEDRTECLDAEDVSIDVRLGAIGDVDRVNGILGYTRYLLALLDDLAVSRIPRSEEPLRILEVGFGGGGTMEAILRHFSAKGIPVEVHGVELSRDLVHCVRRRFSRLGLAADLSAQDGRCLWFDDGAFDVVFSSLTAHHIRSASGLADFFGESRRVGRAGFVVDLDRRFKTPLYCSLIGCFGVSPATVTDGIRSARRAYSSEEIRFVLADAGLAAGSAPVTCRAAFGWPYWVARWKTEKG